MITPQTEKGQRLTHGIVHAGFSGLPMFVARKKVQCSLIRNRLVIPHDTIPSTFVCHNKKHRTEKIFTDL
jgi:hypothetical protein